MCQFPKLFGRLSNKLKVFRIQEFGSVFREIWLIFHEFNRLDSPNLLTLVIPDGEGGGNLQGQDGGGQGGHEVLRRYVAHAEEER